MKLAVVLAMVSKQPWLALLWSSLAISCQGPDEGEPGPPEISVFVNATRVEVIAQQRGSCRLLVDVHEPDLCETVEWEYKGVGEFFERRDCVPDPTCVDEVRLERAGTVIATEKGRAATFSTEITGGEAVVIVGCGEPLNIDLPLPLSGVEFEVQADSDGIHLSATGDRAQSMLGRAVSMSYSDGFSSACRSGSGPLTLPTSPDFSEYIVESFALGTPIVLEDGSVRVYPALRRKEVISRTLPLGPLWQATVAAAQLSPQYEVCDSYCSAWQQACYPTANRDQCTVVCVAEPTLRPSCADEFETKLRCDRGAPACEELARSESATAAPPRACEMESAAYAACIGTAETPSQTEAN